MTSLIAGQNSHSIQKDRVHAHSRTTRADLLIGPPPPHPPTKKEKCADYAQMTPEKMNTGIVHWDDSFDVREDRKLLTNFEDMGPHHLLDLEKLSDFFDVKNETVFGKGASVGITAFVGVFEL